MNAHDSERIKGCSRSSGSARLLAGGSRRDRLQHLHDSGEAGSAFRGPPRAGTGTQGSRSREVIAVGGCYAEAQRERLFELYPFVDVAFGPGSIPHLADWLGAGGGIARGRFAEWTEFAAELPVRRERRFQAWVQISMGCNSKCAYCIVPAVRGREQSRRPGDIVAEVSALARDGVSEITLLGQNVNSWGRDLLPELKTEFGELLRALDRVDGIERIRFTSPHPKDFRDPVIAAMAECESVCEHIHLPLQSGSTRILKAMRRTYTRERYLALVDKLLRRSPTSPLRPMSSSGFRERAMPTSRRRSKSCMRSVTTGRSRSCSAREAAPRLRRCTTRCRRRSRRSGSSDSSRSFRNSLRGGMPNGLARRAGARRGPEQDRSVDLAGAHTPEHDRQLQRERGGWRAGRRPHRGLDVDNPTGNTGRLIPA